MHSEQLWMGKLSAKLGLLNFSALEVKFSSILLLCLNLKSNFLHGVQLTMFQLVLFKKYSVKKRKNKFSKK